MENNRTIEKTELIKKRRRKNRIVQISIFLAVILILAVLTMLVLSFIVGNKTFETSESAVYINKKDQILCASIEKLEKDYYKTEDLEQYVESQISLYNGNAGEEKIKMTSFKKEKNTVKLFVRYENSKIYEQFNGQDFFVGSLKEAKEKGYELPKKAPRGDNLKIVIMQERMGVKVSGEIVYTSANVKKVNQSTVTMKDKEDQETDLIMVIYK